MDDIPSFTSVGWWYWKQWPVAYVPCDRERDRQNTGPPGAEVVIDGRHYRVIAVERHMPLTPIKPGEIIGLMVEPV